mmetsp:Transcript_70157/g.146772  ORF Transcript_70157/g.146772 Transcript_70157/m.146772 type:complete len:654 (-) Transcript_70157:1258-3219(-)
MAGALGLEALLELVELVLDLPALLVGQGLLLLAILELLLEVLDLLLLVLVGHGGALADLDLVASTIVDLVGALVALVLAIVDLHGLTLDTQAATLHDPLLRGDAVTELLVVGNDEDSALVVLDGQDQGTQTLTIQVVGGLIEDENVRILPHRSGQDDLDLHASGELVDLGVGGGLRIDAKVAQVLLDTRLGQLLRHKTGHGGLSLVLTLHHFQVTHLDQNILLDPGVGLHGLELPLHLVLEGLLLFLLSSVENGVRNHGTGLVLLGLLGIFLGVSAATDSACDAVDAPLRGSGLLLVHGELLGLELHALLVVVACEAPHDVRSGGLLHVLLQVMEGVLGDVGHSQTGSLPDAALSGLLLADQDLDGCGLAGSVGTDHGHSAHLGHCEVHVHDGGLVLGGVLVAHVRHSEDDLTAALHALHGTRLREHELHGLVAEFEVGFLLGVLLDELTEALALLALEGLELAVLEIDDVGAHLVQEGGEVGGADDAALEGLQPILEPLDVVHIQVASGLVQHQHIGVHELGGAELHLHLPATGVAGHRQLQVGGTVGATRVAEASLLHQLLALLLGHRGLDLVDLVAGVHDPPPAGLVDAENGEAIVLHAHLLVLDLVLHEDTLQLVTLGETFQLLVGDGSHEGRFTALVGAQQAVEAVAL